MKKIFRLATLAIALFSAPSCNDSSTKSTESTNKDSVTLADTTAKQTVLTNCIKPGTNETQIEYWQIPTADAEAMIKHYHDAGFDQSNVVDESNDIFQKVAARYKIANVQKVNARYRKEDANCYCERRHITDDLEKCKVKDFKTKILVVHTIGADSHADETLYFDCYSICPPPPGCNGDASGNQNKTSRDSSKKK